MKVIIMLCYDSDGPIPSDTPIFSSHPPSTVSAIEGQDLVLDCTKGIRNVSSSIQ